MQQSVAFMAGISYFVLGLSLFLRTNDWIAWVRHLQSKGRNGELKIGMLHLAAGAFILGFHWNWHGLSILLTLIGLKALIEAIFYLLVPGSMQTVLGWIKPTEQAYRVAGIVTIIVALIILYDWWWQTSL